jgi:hypothetical protein
LQLVVNGLYQFCDELLRRHEVSAVNVRACLQCTQLFAGEDIDSPSQKAGERSPSIGTHCEFKMIGPWWSSTKEPATIPIGTMMP